MDDFFITATAKKKETESGIFSTIPHQLEYDGDPYPVQIRMYKGSPAVYDDKYGDYICSIDNEEAFTLLKKVRVLVGDIIKMHHDYNIAVMVIKAISLNDRDITSRFQSLITSDFDDFQNELNDHKIMVELLDGSEDIYLDIESINYFSYRFGFENVQLGDFFSLHKEKHNPYDSKSICLVSGEDTIVGYVNRNQAYQLQDIIDDISYCKVISIGDNSLRVKVDAPFKYSSSRSERFKELNMKKSLLMNFDSDYFINFRQGIKKGDYVSICQDKYHEYGEKALLALYHGNLIAYSNDIDAKNLYKYFDVERYSIVDEVLYNKLNIIIPEGLPIYVKDNEDFQDGLSLTITAYEEDDADLYDTFSNIANVYAETIGQYTYEKGLLIQVVLDEENLSVYRPIENNKLNFLFSSLLDSYDLSQLRKNDFEEYEYYSGCIETILTDNDDDIKFIGIDIKIWQSKPQE